MPLVRITHPRGALPLEQKRRLVAALTDIVLDVEVDAVTDAGRMVTVIQFHEAADHDWAVAGQLRSETSAQPNHFIVDLVVRVVRELGQRRPQRRRPEHRDGEYQPGHDGREVRTLTPAAAARH